MCCVVFVYVFLLYSVVLFVLCCVVFRFVLFRSVVLCCVLSCCAALCRILTHTFACTPRVGQVGAVPLRECALHPPKYVWNLSFSLWWTCSGTIGVNPFMTSIRDSDPVITNLGSFTCSVSGTYDCSECVSIGAIKSQETLMQQLRVLGNS